jgi:cytochrome c oxidase subunit I+III
VVVDLCLSPWRQRVQRNPWHAGTLEWLEFAGQENWGVRSVPLIESRYPLWDQNDFVRQVDEGRYFLPDAEEGRRELMITSVLDASPIQVARITGPSVIPMLAAISLGGVFILTTFHFYWAALASGLAALFIFLWWLWTGTGLIPEKAEKHAGLGIMLPLYASGPASSGWWAMFITMIGDATAFAGLIFGYFFFWTVHADFPPEPLPGQAGPGIYWPMVALALLLAGWALTIAARETNACGKIWLARVALAVAAAANGVGGLAGLAGPWFSGLDPTRHVYPAIVWVLVIWMATHALLGVIMQLFVLARSLAGRMTPVYDGDVRNITVYEHFLALSALITFLVIGFFPTLA